MQHARGDFVESAGRSLSFSVARKNGKFIEAIGGIELARKDEVVELRQCHFSSRVNRALNLNEKKRENMTSAEPKNVMTNARNTER
jgi:hypothetical protein